MSSALALLIDREWIDRCRLVAELPAPRAKPGEVVLRTLSFGLSANNVTYAAYGTSLGYWNLFPTMSPWGLLPVWGFAEVVESRHPQVVVGRRVFGLLPSASCLTLVPAHVESTHLADASPHRRGFAALYQRYSFVDSVPGEAHHVASVAAPLATTASLLAGHLIANLGETRTVVILSASSKTALALAFLLRGAHPELEVVGVTRARNVAFCRGLRVYDRILAYADMARVDRVPTECVDFAGDPLTLRTLRGHLGDGLRRVHAVGATHRTRAGAGQGAVEPFFAPYHYDRRVAHLGAAQATADDAHDWGRLRAWLTSWLDIQVRTGMAGAEAAYRELLAGRGQPARAHCVVVGEHALV